MRWSEIGSESCSVARTLGIIGDRWTLMILRNCFLGSRRFAGHAALPANRQQPVDDLELQLLQSHAGDLDLDDVGLGALVHVGRRSERGGLKGSLVFGDLIQALVEQPAHALLEVQEVDEWIGASHLAQT